MLEIINFKVFLLHIREIQLKEIKQDTDKTVSFFSLEFAYNFEMLVGGGNLWKLLGQQVPEA